MAVAVLALFATCMLVLGAWRRQVQLRRTGDSGNRRAWRPDGSPEWWALAGTDVGYLAVGVGSPLAYFTGLPLFDLMDRPVLRGVGVVLAVLGVVLASSVSCRSARPGGSVSTSRTYCPRYHRRLRDSPQPDLRRRDRHVPRPDIDAATPIALTGMWSPLRGFRCRSVWPKSPTYAVSMARPMPTTRPASALPPRPGPPGDSTRVPDMNRAAPMSPSPRRHEVH